MRPGRMARCWNAVVRIDIPHAIFHAQDLALIVGGAILEPPRVVTIKPALVVGRETSLPSAVSATPLVPTIALGAIGGDLIEWHIAWDAVMGIDIPHTVFHAQ